MRNWSHGTESFRQDINMHHLIREEQRADISKVVQKMNVVLHEMHEIKWCASLNRTEAIRGNGLNKLGT